MQFPVKAGAVSAQHRLDAARQTKKGCNFAGKSDGHGLLSMTRMCDARVTSGTAHVGEVGGGRPGPLTLTDGNGLVAAPDVKGPQEQRLSIGRL